MLKILFLEEFAVLHLKMAGFLEVDQRSHTIGVPRGGERGHVTPHFQKI